MAGNTIATSHPYVIKTSGVQGGQPCIKDTRVSVAAVWNLYDIHGLSPREIVSQFPQLSLSAVLDALSYAAEHQQEITEILKSEESSHPG